MRKITLSEVVIALLGVAMVLYGSLIMSLPKTFDRVIRMQQEFFKYGVLIMGIIFLIFVLWSIFSTTPLLQRQKTKSIILNLVVLSVALFFCVIVLEVFLEVTPSPGCKQGDPIYDHSYIPNCISNFKTGEWNTKVIINSEGLRDDKILPKTEGELRILMLGDSFTWGYGVEKEETFSDLLEQKLNQDEINANVINAGATSYSPILEYLFLKNKGISYQPDVVVLNFDLSDLQDDYLREQKAQFDQHGKVVAVYNPDKSGFIYTFRKRLQITNLINGIFVGLDKILPPPTEIEYPFINDIRYDRYGITRDATVENEEEHWQRTFSYIDQIAELCQQNNITFILSIYPYGHQISGTEWSKGRHNAGLLLEKEYSDRAEKKIQQYATEKNISFISMFDGFRLAEATQAPLYFSYDGHFNQRGHQVAAEALYTGLVKMNKIQKKQEDTEKQEQGKIFILPTPFQQDYGK